MQPESTMVRVLGTKVRGAVVYAFFSIYLVPSHVQLGLFLVEPSFVYAFVATWSRNYLGWSQSRIDWFDK